GGYRAKRLDAVPDGAGAGDRELLAADDARHAFKAGRVGADIDRAGETDRAVQPRIALGEPGEVEGEAFGGVDAHWSIGAGGARRGLGLMAGGRHVTALSPSIFRFAPSPNGLLHPGHAYSALFTQHWARLMGGRVLLRIEDIDTVRCRPEFVEALYEDLDWIGFAFTGEARIQSRHFADYEAAAARLRAAGLLYPCFCTRSRIAAEAGGLTDPDGAPLYSGRCRGVSKEERERRIASGEAHQWRLDMERAVALGGPLTIVETMPTPDQRPTLRPAAPERWGDVVLVRKDTPTSYHLSVVVDDALQGITHVTRGMDLYAATDIHRLVQALLGLPSPF